MADEISIEELIALKRLNLLLYFRDKDEPQIFECPAFLAGLSIHGIFNKEKKALDYIEVQLGDGHFDPDDPTVQSILAGYDDFMSKYGSIAYRVLVEMRRDDGTMFADIEVYRLGIEINDIFRAYGPRIECVVVTRVGKSI